MLDYTIVAGQRVWKSIQRISLVFSIITQIVSMLFLGYVTFEGNGFFPLNITLLVLSAAYFIFYLATITQKGVLRTRVKIFFKWSKRGIKLVNLGVMLYALLSASDRSTLDIILAFLSFGCWALDILFEIAAAFIKSWGKLMKEALIADVESIPIVNRFFTRAEEETPNKQRVLLDELVAERKAAVALKKQEERAAEAQKKADEKFAKKEGKRAAKLAKRKAKVPELLEEVAITEE